MVKPIITTGISLNGNETICEKCIEVLPQVTTKIIKTYYVNTEWITDDNEIDPIKDVFNYIGYTEEKGE